MTKKRLMQARHVLTRYWQGIFHNPTYDKYGKCLYSDDGQWYLAQDTDESNPYGVCLYRAS